jgi:hypothetical protein
VLGRLVRYDANGELLGVMGAGKGLELFRWVLGIMVEGLGVLG